MFQIKIIYDNEQDRKLISLIDTKLPFFVDCININTLKSRKEGFRILNYWSAKKLPFVEVTDNEGKLVKIFYSELGNSINQLIKWLNERKNQEITQECSNSIQETSN